MTGDDLNSSSLSDRELQIVELVAGGLTNQEIAEKLEISKRTVDNHISNILTKTATGNRVALVRWALQWGKVCLDEVNCCVLPTPGSGANRNGTVSIESNRAIFAEVDRSADEEPLSSNA
jgi:DNA-binding CsgD family transcriptional regulator